MHVVNEGKMCEDAGGFGVFVRQEGRWIVGRFIHEVANETIGGYEW